MQISNTTFIILLVSIFVGLIIMVAAFFITRHKVNKLKKEVIADTSKYGEYQKAVQRKSSGEMLWNLKDKSKNPLDDSQLDFLISTVIRNKYKTINVVLSDSNYEETSLVKLAKAKKQTLKPDLTIIFPKADFRDKIDKSYKSLTAKKIIAIVNASKRNKEIKNLLKYLKLIGAKHEYAAIDKGIILITK